MKTYICIPLLVLAVFCVFVGICYAQEESSEPTTDQGGSAPNTPVLTGVSKIFKGIFTIADGAITIPVGVITKIFNTIVDVFSGIGNALSGMGGGGGDANNATTAAP
ncbi:hypothetical protein C0J52_10296 [Blattella germanica]|nr:hypothetical protein C0J52_10296 [Blattella germanica]